MTRIVSGIFTLLVIGAIACPCLRGDDPKPPPEKKEPEKKDAASAEKMLKAGQLLGKLMGTDTDKNTLKIEIDVPKLDPNAVTALANAQNDLNKALLQTNPNSRAQAIVNAQNNIAKQQAKLYTTEKKTIELQTVEKVVVRSANPPAEFDEKGSPKKLSTKELEELRGPDKKIPGYASEFGKLEEGQSVVISLAKRTGTAAKPPKFKTKEEEADWLLDNLPRVTMIVILAEPVKTKK